LAPQFYKVLCPVKALLSHVLVSTQCTLRWMPAKGRSRQKRTPVLFCSKHIHLRQPVFKYGPSMQPNPTPPSGSDDPAGGA
jgi:hypothetical protein